ncbi:M48 family metalloprotease [Streptomyces sp. NPDC004561]
MSQPPDTSAPPPYPEPPRPEATVPAPPAYPAAPSAAPPPYPGEPAYPTAPSSGPPPYPGGPAYPTAAPQHPTTSPAAPPQYPGEHAHSTAAPQYPTAPPAVPPQYPGEQGHSPYPAAPSAAPPQYPGGPAYPTAAPQYPATAQGHPTAPPAYPAEAASHLAAPPAYPAQAPTYPGGPAPAGASAGAAGVPATGLPPHLPHQAVPGHPAPPQSAAPLPPQAPEPAPDDLDYRHLGARRHVAEHQRGADATAIGRLAVQLPGALVSLALVSSLALGILGSVMGTLVILAWVASGLLVFHRPTELAFARHVLKLRLPTQEERARLEPVWNEVTARAGIEPGTYELMVENSDELNAAAVAGHVVGVTTYSLNRIPSSNLAAVLAHELGHHTGGHAWAGLLGYWYSLPGRIAWAVTRALARFAIAVASVFSMAATGFLILFMGLMVVAAFVTAWYVTIPLVVAPYLLAYAGRRGELRADQQAAELGFARHLAEVLHHFQAEEAATKAALTAQGQRFKEPGTLARLLSTHPDHHTRLSALEPYLGLRR